MTIVCRKTNLEMSDNEFVEIDEDDADDADLVIGDTSSENSEEEGNDVNDPQSLLEPVVKDTNRGQGHQGHPNLLSDGPVDPETFRQNEEHLLSLMHQYGKERTNLVQQIEAEEKNRKWYYDQIEMASRKIRSLPVNDPHAKQAQPGPTRKHLEFEIARLRETMHESFGTNELIIQRREARVQRIRQIEAELLALQQQHRDQVQKQREASLNDQDQGHKPHTAADMDQITMATQTDKNGLDLTDARNNPNIPAMYHGSWQIEKDDNAQNTQGHQDLASVMSFNSTNTSSSQGSGSGGQGQRLPQQQNAQQQHQPQPLAPQQLGTKVEMVYGLLSMLGTHDKDDMSRTLLAMSSSQDSCIAMRQSGCLPLLIQLLHGSDKDSALLGNTRGSKAARARAAAALHNIVHSHPDDKRGRREARVLRLLEQIRAHCDQLREATSDEDEEGKEPGFLIGQMDHHPGYAIAALMKLSFDEEHRHAICTLGGLHAIAELLQVDHEVNSDTSEQYNITMRRYACMALTNLTFGDGTNKASLCSMKPSMRALVSQLFSSNEELCQVAASVLRNLSWKADLASKKTLREVGGVTSLMESAMRVTKETTLKSILSALWNLSAHCSENKADICAVDGALMFLIASLTYKSPSKTTAIIENGGGILRNVSSHIAVREDYRKSLRQHGCLQILLKHLRSPSLTIVSNACGTLWNLSARCAEDQQALWEMGAVNMLRNLVNSKHKMISMGSSAALKNLLAARPAMKNLELNKQGTMNRPTLHVRKQRALESEIDQNLSETCENVESPRDSPVESKKTENGHFVYPVYQLQENEHRRSLLRGQVLPRSQSGGDNTLSPENQQQRVSRSGSQDSVGSTHSDISHDRSKTNLTARNQVNMGGSLDRNKETIQPVKRYNSDGRCERNPLGPPNSRILQVMQEVALHAGLENQGPQSKDSAVFKTPLPVSHLRVHHQQQQNHQQSHDINNPITNAQQAKVYQMYLMQNQGNSPQYNSRTSKQYPQNAQENSRNDQQQNEEDEKPLDYSLKYRENNVQNDSKNRKGPQPAPPMQPMVGNFVGNSQAVPNIHNQFGTPAKQVFFDNRFQYNSAYAETDLDAQDQLTDFSARYGAEYQAHQYAEQRMAYDNNYEESDPNCADCKLEEARRYNDRLEQTMEHDQVTTFCTEDTPYLSTATSLTDLSTAAKILEEAQNQYSGNEREYNGGDEIQNFSSKYGESQQEKEERSEGKVKQLCQGHRYDTDHSSRSGSQTTDQCTGTTVIPNYNLAKVDQIESESLSHSSEDFQERSFHNTSSRDAPADQTKTYCEEGTPLCFSRVSSLSSLHSSEANDRQEKRPSGPLQSIEENEDANHSLVKRQTATGGQHAARDKNEDSRETNYNGEKEHKTVTFDEKEHIQETPMMFSRCTSLGSLSSFDTQSVHSSVFSEYSRRASENVSPSELPDSPSESMPSSPGRVKSPERFHDGKKSSARLQLFPDPRPPQFTNKANKDAKHIHPLTAFVNLGNNIRIESNNRQYDIEIASSCKSEAPVVYADEGTPPMFQDNLSTLSEITTDNYDINNKTLTENPDSRDSNRSTCSTENEENTTVNKSQNSQNQNFVHSDQDKLNKPVQSRPGQHQHQQQKPPTQNNKPNHSISSINSDHQARFKSQNEKPDNRLNEKGDSSTSDVSEGEDDLLAKFISSAMPNSSKKMKKSSSDNAIKRKSSNSSKTDSGSSSRSKTPAKTPIDSPAGKSGILSKRTPSDRSKQGSLSETPQKESAKSNRGYGENIPSANKQKSMLPKPTPHRDVMRVLQQSEEAATLNSSIDSSRSDDTPFNISNTLSVINRPANHRPHQAMGDNTMLHHQIGDKSGIKRSINPNQQTRGGNASSANFILQKVENLSVYDDDEEDEGIKTYATEDTPFSGSIPASPRNDRKFLGGQPPPDLNQDSVTTFATEGTPFSGSVPGSPKPCRASNFNYIETEEDTIKCYNTEDTPFTGSAPESPKTVRKQAATLQTNQNQNHGQQYQQDHPVPNTSIPPNQVNTPRNTANCKPFMHKPLSIDTSEDTVHSYATESMPYNKSNLQSTKTNLFNNQSAFNPQLLASLSNGYEGDEDQIKTFTTEGATLLNNQPAFNPQLLASLSDGYEASEDQVKTFATEGATSLNNQSRFNPQLLGNIDCISRGFEADEDQIKTFATEGTPLNFSRIGSFSDLSSLNTHFEEKAKIDCQPPVVANDSNLDDTNSDNSSLMEENEELLSEIIQSAMPAAKPGKSNRKSLERKVDGSTEKKGTFSFDGSSNKKSNKTATTTTSLVPAAFQPQRTSSLAQESPFNQALRQQNELYNTEDQIKTFAVEDTPNNQSVKTSLSDLTVDTDSVLDIDLGDSNRRDQRLPSAVQSGSNRNGSVFNGSSNCTDASLTATYGTSNDSVFIQSFGHGDSMQVYKTEGTPQTFSCNDSLSTLSFPDDEPKDEVSQRIASIAQQISKSGGQDVAKGHLKPTGYEVKANEELPRSESRSSGYSNNSMHSVKELERHVIGQSSEDQSVKDEEHLEQKCGDEIKNFGVEDTPLCFSRSSSLSSINDQIDEKPNQPSNANIKQQESERSRQLTAKDQNTSYKMEHTPLCFSRNSSLSSLSLHSDEDDDPDDLALLEDCISSALPPPTRPNKSNDRRRSSHGPKVDNSSAYRKPRSSDTSNSKYSNNHHASARNYSSADELESSGTHDSRYTSWRQQPHKSCDEIFKKPTMDSKGRPCRRSRSQDSEKKMLKQYKDSSNKELAQQYVGQVARYGSGGTFDQSSRDQYQNQEAEEIEKQRRQIISESQNLTRSIEHQVRELEYQTQGLGINGEKSDEHENEKNESPTSEQNFFMTCSGLTEISVESISKQSFPGNMALYDTDDDILESSLMRSRFCGDGGDSSMVNSGLERTLTGSMSVNTTLTETGHRANVPMDLSITSEDEKALAENANIVMSEMAASRMGMSGSTIEDDRFIEHETLSLVSNDYISDTASEASITWSLSSDRTSEYTESLASTECESPQMRRPKILKPEDKLEQQQRGDNVIDAKSVRGRRKPLYHSKSVSSAQSSSIPAATSPRSDQLVKGKLNNTSTGVNKQSPRTVPGAAAAVPKKAQTLRTLPQACSTPVKVNPNQSAKVKAAKTTQPQRSASLDQKSLNVKNNNARRTNANNSGSYNTPTKIPSKMSPRSRSEGGEVKDKPKTLSKQGTFVKESTNRNAPIISPEEKTNYNVKLRQLKDSDSSLSNRNSSGSSKSVNSNNLSLNSDDSPQEHSFSSTHDASSSLETTPKKKDSKLRRSIGTSQLPNSKKNLHSPGSKIPSPSRSTLNKSGSTGNVKKTPGKPAPLLKTNSGSSLVKTNSGSSSSLKKISSQQDVKKSSSNSSLRNGSRPSTPVGYSSIKETPSKTSENNKKGSKKAVTSKISGFLKKDGKEAKVKSVSKLPVAKSKSVSSAPTKRDASPRPAINRNTVILDESSVNVPIVDGIRRSSTFDKLNATNEFSAIPSHDNTDKSLSRNLTNESIDLDKTKKFDHDFEVGIEYSLDDAWASRVERSIEIMSKSIEDNKNSTTGYYDHNVDINKMNFSNSPAKRLSKSGSMSEIEFEYGRVHSGTWKKKKSHNDFALLPNADETSKTLPLVKRAENLNFNMGRSSECLSQYDSESEDVWIRRDDKMRMSDNSMSVKSKRKGFKGSSSFLPIKNVVSKVFGSKKSEKDKQSKSVLEIDKQSRSFISEKELRKLNETNSKSSKKDKELRMNKSEIIKPSKSDLKTEAKLAKAELKAEVKQLKAEAKLKKAEMKALKKGIKMQPSVEVIKRKDSESQQLNTSQTSLKKSAEDLIDIDKSDDEDSCSVASSPTMSLSQNATRNDSNKLVANGALQNGSLGKNESVFYSQTIEHNVAEKLSPGKAPSESTHNSLNRNQSGVHNKSVKQSPTFQHATKTEMLLARRQLMMNSTSSQDRSDTEDESKRKCIVTTV